MDGGTGWRRGQPFCFRDVVEFPFSSRDGGWRHGMWWGGRGRSPLPNTSRNPGQEGCRAEQRGGTPADPAMWKEKVLSRLGCQGIAFRNADPAWPLPQTLEAIAAAGFDGVELASGSIDLNAPDSLQRLVLQHGPNIAVLHLNSGRDRANATAPECATVSNTYCKLRSRHRTRWALLTNRHVLRMMNLVDVAENRGAISRNQLVQPRDGRCHGRDPLLQDCPTPHRRKGCFMAAP